MYDTIMGGNVASHKTVFITHNCFGEEKRELISWCFELSQPHRVIKENRKRIRTDVRPF